MAAATYLYDLRNMLGIEVAKQYTAEEFIGKGRYGNIYETKVKKGDKHKKIAIKYENRALSNGKKMQDEKLNDEFKKLKLLEGGPGIMSVFEFGSDKNINYLTMELLGPDLEDILIVKRKLSVRRSANLAEQMINAVEHIHNMGLVHRALKPANILMGRKQNKKELLHIIDFREAEEYIDKETKKHIRMRADYTVGCTVYLSLKANMGYTHSRRDDMESIGYMLHEMIVGELPWKEHEDYKCKCKKPSKLDIKWEPIEEFIFGSPKQVVTFSAILQESDVPGKTGL